MLLVWLTQGVNFRSRSLAVPVDSPTAFGAQYTIDGVCWMPKATIRPDAGSSGPLQRIAPARIGDGKIVALQAR